MESHNKIIEISDLTVSFDGSKALDSVSANVEKGDFIAITGPNGGGKSTLLKSMLKLLRPTSGSVTYYWEGEAAERLRFGYLPQKSTIDSRFPITVEETVASGLLGNRHGSYSSDMRQRIDATLALMGIDSLRRQTIGTLSGGQLQRTLLGRAIISDPDIVVLDEPLSYVDRMFVEQIYGIIADISKRATIILVSHEMTVISEMANRHWIVDRTLHECHATHHYLHTECE